MEVDTMLMRTDPFRELDRLTQQVFGTNGTLGRPAVMPMDAWRDGDTFHVEFDLPGINPHECYMKSTAHSTDQRYVDP
jgi:HSP20 family protein